MYVYTGYSPLIGCGMHPHLYIYLLPTPKTDFFRWEYGHIHMSKIGGVDKQLFFPHLPGEGC